VALLGILVLGHPAHVLQRDLDPGIEDDGIVEMPAIRADVPADRLVIEERDAEIRRARDPQAPGCKEIILGPRAPDGRRRFPVDVDLLVALAEPGRAAHPDAQDRADEMALALGIEEE
jgi:hypothetical protein